MQLNSIGAKIQTNRTGISGTVSAFHTGIDSDGTAVGPVISLWKGSFPRWEGSISSRLTSRWWHDGVGRWRRRLCTARSPSASRQTAPSTSPRWWASQPPMSSRRPGGRVRWHGPSQDAALPCMFPCSTACIPAGNIIALFPAKKVCSL